MDLVLTPEAERLYNLGRDLFAAILLRDSSDEATWKHRADTFRRHGLLSFLEANPFYKPRELNVEESRLDDVRYRRHLIRRLKAPHPGKTRTVTLVIDRLKLLQDNEYLHKMAAVLSFKWALKLSPTDDVSALALPHQDVETLTNCLDRMGLHESDGNRVGAHVMRTMAERLVDTNERFLAVVAEMRAAFAEVRAELEPLVTAVCDQALIDSRARIDAITEDTLAKLDRLSVEIREDFAAQKAQTQAVLDANAPSGLSPEEEFRIEVKRREREHRAANRLSRKTKAILWALATAAAVGCAFFLEVDGVTLVEALR